MLAVNANDIARISLLPDMIAGLSATTRPPSGRSRVYSWIVVLLLSVTMVASSGFVISVIYSSGRNTDAINKANSLPIGVLVFLSCMSIMVIARLLRTGVDISITCTTSFVLIVHAICLTVVFTNFVKGQKKGGVPSLIVAAVSLNYVMDFLVFISVTYYYKTAPDDRQGDTERTRLNRRVRRELSTTGSVEITIDFARLNDNIAAKPPQYSSIMPPDEVACVDDWNSVAVHPGHAKLTVSSKDRALFVQNPDNSSHGRLPTYESATRLARPLGDGPVQVTGAPVVEPVDADAPHESSTGDMIIFQASPR